MEEEKLTLNWKELHMNMFHSYEILRRDEDFCDVTLVSEDEVQLVAHQVVLAACSPVLKGILRSAGHPRPVVFLGGVQVNCAVLCTGL